MGFVRNYISLVENGREPSHRFIHALELIEQAPLPNMLQSSVVREEPYGSSPAVLIKARRKELGLSLEDVARMTGYRKSTLHNVEEGHAPASEKLLRVLSTHLDLPLEELMGGLDYHPLKYTSHPMGTEARMAPEPGVTARVIPLLSWAQAGTAQAWDAVYEHEGFVGFNVQDPKAIAVQIRGDGMAPTFPHGTIAILYPSREAKHGDLVIARLNDGTVMFNRLHVDGAQYTFISLNPIYPPLTVERSKIEKVLPVGGTFQSHL